MKPRILTTILLCTATLTTTVNPSIAAVTPESKATEQTLTNFNSSSQDLSSKSVQTSEDTTNISQTAFINLGIKNNKLTDSKSQNQWNPTGKPAITTDDEMNGDVLNLDGKSAFYTVLSDSQQDQIKKELTIEAYFKYDPNMDVDNEHEIFSSQQYGGFGLGVQHGEVIFFAHDSQNYKKPSGKLKTGQWVHAVGVIDKNKTANLYLDGKLVQSVKMNGDLKFAENTKDLVLGGDALPGSHVQSEMKGKIKSARLYSQALNADQILQLSQSAHNDQHKSDHVEQTMETQLVGPKQIAAGATYGLNVHARQLKADNSQKLSIDVVYNPNQFEYIDSERKLGNDKTTIEKVSDGRIRITSSAKLSNADFIYYAKTRLGRINLRAKENATGQADIHFEQIGQSGEIQLGSPLIVDVKAKNPLDYNGDGVIGVGDVALAPKSKKSDVAAKAEIKPYKHVIVLTTDGGGDPWDPNGIFYDMGIGVPIWTKNPYLMKKRQNKYTMDLFNKQFAMSTTAKSVKPAISAQNYISMLHGRPWATLPQEYRGTNATMGQQYFADFGKGDPLFPSVFKVLQKNNPTQQTAAFAEWRAIVNGIVEPDAAVKTKQSESLKSFDDVADYIGTDDFKNTSMVYMQSDFTDHTGHTKGWYNNNYWKQYYQYDQLFKKVMDKLEATGHIHDTLVIANSDHGGAGMNHGANNNPNRNIFIAMGGETVDSGRRLHGGSNSDITALVLNALQVPNAPHMVDSKVFDKSAFLSQSELSKKKRDVETIQIKDQGDTVQLGLTNLKKRGIKSVDMRIDLKGHSIRSIRTVKGARILRKKIENGVLKLTVTSKHQFTGRLATIKLKHSETQNPEKVSIKEAMAAITDGTEVLVDLDNDNGATTHDGKD